MGRNEFESMRRGALLTGIASVWAIGVSTIESWQSPVVIGSTIVLFLLALVHLVQGAVRLRRDSSFY